MLALMVSMSRLSGCGLWSLGLGAIEPLKGRNMNSGLLNEGVRTRTFGRVYLKSKTFRNPEPANRMLAKAVAGNGTSWPTTSRQRQERPTNKMKHKFRTVYYDLL